MSILGDPLDPPCPCASGRPLRACCAMTAGPDESDVDTEPVLMRLVAFGARGEFASARRRLNRSLLAELTAAQADALEATRRQELQTGMLCFLHMDLPIQHGDSIGTVLLRREGAAMPARQRSALANMVAHPTSLYEIVDVFPGRGLELRDLLRHFTVRVRERSASTMVEPGWLFLTKVRRQPDGTPVMDIPLLHFDADLRPAVDDWRARQRAVGASRIEPRTVLAELYRIWQMAMATVLTKPAPPVHLQNHQGEPLELCEAELRCDGRRLGAWLAQAPDWSPDDEEIDADATDEAGAAPSSWTWFELTADGLRLALGKIEMAGDRCLLHVNSRARLDRAVAILRDAVGAELLDVETTSAAELMARAKAGKARPRGEEQGDVPPAVQAAILQRTMDAHYRKWIDEPVPAFGGRTPRAMAKVDPAAVVRVVWQICNGPTGVQYDARWMFAELGLKPVGEGEFTAGLIAE